MKIYRTCRGLLATLTLLAAAGCGGGSGASDKGTVEVTVLNTLGEPVGAAEVVMSHRPMNNVNWSLFARSVTDANGEVQFQHVPAGEVGLLAEHSGYEMVQGRNPQLLARGEAVELTIQLQPQNWPAAGAISAKATAADVAEDGQVLEFTLDFTDAFPGSSDWYITMAACEPRPENDLAGPSADCILDGGAFDAPYAVDADGQPIALDRTSPAERDEAGPSTVALLLDQSANFVTRDPGDARLLAARYFADGASEQQPVLLGAFASDRPAAGEISALPARPLTLLPLEDPQPTSQGRSLFAAINELASLEGGASAMLAATDQALDALTSSGGPGTRDLIVVSDGQDELCGSGDDCLAALDAVVAKAHSAQVRVVTVGVTGSAGDAEAPIMNLLGQETGGGAFWADDADGLAGLLVRVRTHLSSGSPAYHARFRIRSPVVGAFAPGRVVMGRVVLDPCGWDCELITVPFAVRID
jgi:hypothetical protein